MPVLSDATGLFVGPTPVDAVYVGATQVWPGFEALSAAVSYGGSAAGNNAAILADDMELIAATGASAVRMDLYWHLIETADGVFDWAQPDLMFDAADAEGLDVLFILHSTPAWAGPSQLGPPTNLQDYADFCTAAAARYKARGSGGHWWQVWNEVNTEWHWSDPLDVQGYVDLLEVAYAAIKAEDPTATVVLGSILRGGQDDAVFGAYYSQMWLADFYTAGGKGHYDVLSFHPYCYPFDPLSTTEPEFTDGASVEHGFNGLADLRAVMTANGDTSPIWLTEWGQPTGTDVYAVTEAEQATYIANAFERAAQFPYVEKLFVFNHRNVGTDLANREHNFGLVGNDWTAKDAYDAMRTTAHEVNDVTLDETTATPPAYVGGAIIGTSFTATRTVPAIVTQAGDVLVTFLMGNSNNDPGPTTTDPGWTLIGSVALDGADVYVAVKEATGSQGAVTWTWPGSHNHSAISVAYRGALLPTELAATATNRIQTVRLGNFISSSAGSRLVVGGFQASDGDVRAWPAYFTERQEIANAVAGGVVADVGFNTVGQPSGVAIYDARVATGTILILAAAVWLETA